MPEAKIDAVAIRVPEGAIVLPEAAE